MRRTKTNLIISIVLLVSFTLLSIFGCTTEDDAINSNVDYINYGTSFGFCGGYCINSNTITASEVTLEKSGWPNDLVPKITYSEELAESYLQELFEKVDFDAFLDLDETIGCPDCADGGAEWIEIKANDQTHKVTFEYFTNEIPELNDILTSLRELNTSLQKEAYLIVDNDTYNNTNTDAYTITEASLNEDLLKLSIQSGGCDGNSWIINLIDSGAVLESNPIQRELKLNIINYELCLTIVHKTYEIDISGLQVDGENQIQLNIQGWDESIIYNY